MVHRDSNPGPQRCQCNALTCSRLPDSRVNENNCVGKASGGLGRGKTPRLDPSPTHFFDAFFLFNSPLSGSLEQATQIYGTRARSACDSQNCAILSIICPFTGNGAFLCVNDVVVDLLYRKDATKLFYFFAKLTQINTLSIQF